LSALVPLPSPANADFAPGFTSVRPRAYFVAQLIAAATQAPQTRTRRRAEPQEAAGAYQSGAPRPAPAGRALSRSL